MIREGCAATRAHTQSWQRNSNTAWQVVLYELSVHLACVFVLPCILASTLTSITFVLIQLITVVLTCSLTCFPSRIFWQVIWHVSWHFSWDMFTHFHSVIWHSPQHLLWHFDVAQHCSLIFVLLYVSLGRHSAVLENVFWTFHLTRFLTIWDWCSDIFMWSFIWHEQCRFRCATRCKGHRGPMSGVRQYADMLAGGESYPG